MKIHHWGFLVLALFITLAFGQDYIVWSGGVSEQERQDAPEGTTKQVFSRGDGSYLSSLDVQVRDKEGSELVDNRGPWLIPDLPDGDYVVEATRASGDKGSASFQMDKKQGDSPRLSR